MNILSTIVPDEELQNHLKEAFPGLRFYFHEDIEAEGGRFLSEAEILITYGEDLTCEHIYIAPSLRWIMVMAAGVEKMPFAAIADCGILVTNARGIHKIAMAEYTIAMLLQYEKKLKKLVENEKAGRWDQNIEVGELYGKTMLILGTGNIGSEVARLAKAFMMKTIGLNRSGHEVEGVDRLYRIEDLPRVLPAADYIISVLPSTSETKGLFKEEHFKKMKDTAVFVNIGRGDLVGNQVLLKALMNKEVAHAVLDVVNLEPLEQSHPFWRREDVTITPHVSSRTDQYLPRAFRIFEKNLHTYIRGGTEYINVIDFNKGY